MEQILIKKRKKKESATLWELILPLFFGLIFPEKKKQKKNKLSIFLFCLIFTFNKKEAQICYFFTNQ